MAHQHPPHIVSLCIALRIVGITTDEKTTELVYQLAEMVQQRGGSFTVAEIIDMQAAWIEKYKTVEPEPTPDR